MPQGDGGTEKRVMSVQAARVTVKDGRDEPTNKSLNKFSDF